MNNFNSELKAFLIENSIKEEDFFTYMESRTKQFPSNTSKEWFGCFPILDDDILIDIRMSVPIIENQDNLLVNIHEYTHAFELYNKLGKKYIENKEESEKIAISMEKKYIKKRVSLK